MPLSEHEQRLLDQMERQLYADDPKLASTLRGSSSAALNRRKLVAGLFAVVAGMGLLVAGVAAPLWPVGVAGFVVMLGGAWLVTSGWQTRAAPTSEPTSSPKATSTKGRPGFMSRIEDRWERRRDGDER